MLASSILYNTRYDTFSEKNILKSQEKHSLVGHSEWSTSDIRYWMTHSVSYMLRWTLHRSIGQYSTGLNLACRGAVEFAASHARTDFLTANHAGGSQPRNMTHEGASKLWTARSEAFSPPSRFSLQFEFKLVWNRHDARTTSVPRNQPEGKDARILLAQAE